MAQHKNRQVIVGDIHGEIKSLKRILRRAGVTDPGGRWSAKDTTLVQLGDVIDRGFHSMASVRLLRRLQAEAPDFGSDVIRLCGNHEQMVMDGETHFTRGTDIRDPEGLGLRLRKEVMDGKIVAAHTDGVRVYTHAGILKPMFDLLIAEMARRTGADDGTDVTFTPHDLVAHLNRRFRSFTAKGKFQPAHHPMFRVDPYRGGRDSWGGPLWAHIDTLKEAPHRVPFHQVVGHTPTGIGRMDWTPDLSIIEADAGMCRGHGGHTVFLEILPSGEIFHYRLQGKRWGKKRLLPVPVPVSN